MNETEAVFPKLFIDTIINLVFTSAVVIFSQSTIFFIFFYKIVGSQTFIDKMRNNMESSLPLSSNLIFFLKS